MSGYVIKRLKWSPETPAWLREDGEIELRVVLSVAEATVYPSVEMALAALESCTIKGWGVVREEFVTEGEALA